MEQPDAPKNSEVVSNPRLNKDQNAKASRLEGTWYVNFRSENLWQNHNDYSRVIFTEHGKGRETILFSSSDVGFSGNIRTHHAFVAETTEVVTESFDLFSNDPIMAFQCETFKDEFNFYLIQEFFEQDNYVLMVDDIGESWWFLGKNPDISQQKLLYYMNLVRVKYNLRQQRVVHENRIPNVNSGGRLQSSSQSQQQHTISDDACIII